MKMLKVAPTAAILLAGAYLTYPYMGTIEMMATESRKPGDKKALELPIDLLNPQLVDKPKRDPFIDRAALESEAKAKVVAALKSIYEAQRAAQRAKKSGTKAKLGRAVVKEVEAQPINPLSGLTLGGTSSSGATGVAFINDKIYSVGEKIPAPDGTEGWILREVKNNQVVLEQKGNRFKLEFAIPTPGSGGGGGGSRATASAGRSGGGKKAAKGFDPFD